MIDPTSLPTSFTTVDDRFIAAPILVDKQNGLRAETLLYAVQAGGGSDLYVPLMRQRQFSERSAETGEKPFGMPDVFSCDFTRSPPVITVNQALINQTVSRESILQHGAGYGDFVEVLLPEAGATTTTVRANTSDDGAVHTNSLRNIPLGTKAQIQELFRHLVEASRSAEPDGVERSEMHPGKIALGQNLGFVDRQDRGQAPAASPPPPGAQ